MTKKPKYCIEAWQSIDHWYWTIYHKNGKVVADGAEGQTKKGQMLRSIHRLLDAIKNGDYRIDG